MSSLPIDITNCLKNLPKTLYRGDQAKRVSHSGQSAMVDQYISQGLFTNLIFNGNPLAVSRSGIQSSVVQHINGWSTSHYLSFSTDIRIARIFAAGLTSKNLNPTYNPKWDAVIFSLDLTKLQWQLKSIGIYVGTYTFNSGPAYFNGVTQVALIDCVTLLTTLISNGQNQYLSELSLARNDNEWLIIPLDPLPPGPNSHIGYSAQLQSCLISGSHFDLI